MQLLNPLADFGVAMDPTSAAPLTNARTTGVETGNYSATRDVSSNGAASFSGVIPNSRLHDPDDQNCYRRPSLSKRTAVENDGELRENLLPFAGKSGDISDVPIHLSGNKIGSSNGIRVPAFRPADDGILHGNQPADDGRVTWGSKIQFFFTVVAYAVGLGPVWRFPYLCQMYGGGAFLIPYFIMLFIEGIPLFVLELGIGQKMRLGSISVWNKVHPMLGGLGISSAIISFLVGVYYIVVISWCLFYVFSSFTFDLPWSRCPSYIEVNYLNDSFGVLPTNETVEECRMSTPSSYFWYRRALRISDSVDDFEGINWAILVCFTIAWLFIFFTMYRGIQSSGRVVYFTVTIPYVVLTIFFIRAVTLRGAGTGIAHMFTPKLHMLWDPLIWLKAATQVFYSLGLGFGSLISYGSYNPRDANVRRDAVAVSLVNCFTSILACIVIFSVLGYKATVAYESCVDDFFTAAETKPILSGILPAFTENVQQNKFDTYESLRQDNFTYEGINVSRLLDNPAVCDLQSELSNIAQGTGLAFIVFADAITKMPWSPFWAVTFFGMLLTLGIGSMIGNLEGVTTPIHDLKINRRMKLWVITAIVCVLSYVIGLVFMTHAGNYWVAVFDDYSGMFSLTTIAFLEMVAISWYYGIDRFFDDIRIMCGARLGLYWKITLKYIGPVLVLLFLVTSIRDLCMTGFLYDRYSSESAELLHARPYPWSVVLCIMLIIVLGLAPIPLIALMRLCGFRGLENLVARANVDRSGLEMMTSENGGPLQMSPVPAAAEQKKFQESDF